MKISETIKQITLDLKVYTCKCDICRKEYEYYWPWFRFKNYGDIEYSAQPTNYYSYHGSDYASEYTCSEECHKIRIEQLNKERIDKQIKKNTVRRKAKREKAQRKRPANVCIHCGKAFKTVRNDAKFCSAICKQADYRKRKNVIR